MTEHETRLMHIGFREASRIHAIRFPNGKEPEMEMSIEDKTNLYLRHTDAITFARRIKHIFGKSGKTSLSFAQFEEAIEEFNSPFPGEILVKIKPRAWQKFPPSMKQITGIDRTHKGLEHIIENVKEVCQALENAGFSISIDDTVSCSLDFNDNEPAVLNLRIYV